MNGSVPWRGPREKDLSFMQGLIEVLTKPEDIILDWFASTGDTLFYLQFLVTYDELISSSPYTCFWVSFSGASVRACYNSGRHIAAFEGDANIFEALLAPLSHPPPPQQKVQGNRVSDKPGEPPQKRQRSIRFCA